MSNSVPEREPKRLDDLVTDLAGAPKPLPGGPDIREQAARLEELVSNLMKATQAPREGLDIREKPTFVQWAGFRFAYLFFGLIAALMVGILAYWVWATPPVALFGNDWAHCHTASREIVL